MPLVIPAFLRPIDRSRRDGPLYPGSDKAPRDFIDPQHVLLKIEANFNSEGLVEFLADKCSLETGRPAVHPEMLVRALVLSALKNVDSYRQMCERITENLASRYYST